MSTWLHPHNVQVKGAAGGQKSKIHARPALRYEKLPNSCGYRDESSCVPRRCVCGSRAAGSTAAGGLGVLLRRWPSHQPEDGTAIQRLPPCCRSRLSSNATKDPARIPLQSTSPHWRRQEILSSVGTKTGEPADISVRRWDLLLRAGLLRPDSRLVPQAEETNLNFLQLAHSGAPCVSKTCLVMWLPDVFSTSRTTSKDPTLTRFPNHEWQSPLLLLGLSLRHWKQTVCRRGWDNSLCINSVWRLASNVAELGTLNMKGRSEEKIRQEKLWRGSFHQSYPNCGLGHVLCLASSWVFSGP